MLGVALGHEVRARILLLLGHSVGEDAAKRLKAVAARVRVRAQGSRTTVVIDGERLVLLRVRHLRRGGRGGGHRQLCDV